MKSQSAMIQHVTGTVSAHSLFSDVKDVRNDVKQMKNKVFCLMCLFGDLYKVQLFQLSRVLI